MAWDFEVVGYEDFDGDRHEGKPSDLSDTWGCLVHCYDSETGQHDYFWAFVPDTFDEWEDWLDYIEGLMGGYGMEM